VATLVAQVCAPQLRQFDVALQCRVHQLGAAATSSGGFDNRQRQRRHSQAFALDDVARSQVPPPQSRSHVSSQAGISGHSDFNSFGHKPREVVPPRGCKTAGDGVMAITPYTSTDACLVGKRSVVHKVDTT
jgi:hypothetical protein